MVICENFPYLCRTEVGHYLVVLCTVIVDWIVSADCAAKKITVVAGNVALSFLVPVIDADVAPANQLLQLFCFYASSYSHCVFWFVICFPALLPVECPICLSGLLLIH